MMPIIPEVAHTPKHKVTIKGKKPSDINLQIILNFTTTNDSCKQRNYIEGAVTPRQIKDTRLIPAETNKFNMEFYLDKYIPGRCGWTALSFFYSVDNSTNFKNHGSLSPLALIDKNKVQKTINYHFKCKNISNKKYCFYKSIHTLASNSTHSY